MFKEGATEDTSYLDRITKLKTELKEYRLYREMPGVVTT